VHAEHERKEDDKCQRIENHSEPPGGIGCATDRLVLASSVSAGIFAYLAQPPEALQSRPDASPQFSDIALTLRAQECTKLVQ
jgi:hypothetical protein